MQAVKRTLIGGSFSPHEAVDLPEQEEVIIIFQEINISKPSVDKSKSWEEFDRLAVESAHENRLLEDDAFKRDKV